MNKYKSVKVIKWKSGKVRNLLTLHTFTFGLIAVTMLVPVNVIADSPRKAAAKGIEHYKGEEYDRALAEFMAALEADPDRDELRYDLGAARYKLQDFPGAAQAFNQAAARQNPRLAADAWYNLGNSLFKTGGFDEAVKAYKNALYLQHDHQDAKHNLELALMMRQMQPQQQQSSSSEGDSSAQQQEQPRSQPQPEDEEQEQPPQQQPQSMQDSLTTAQDSLRRPQPDQQTEMTPEEALQLLQALENDEQEAQKEKLKRQFGQPSRLEKDW